MGEMETRLRAEFQHELTHSRNRPANGHWGRWPDAAR
jgi:hypothetical protein